jgi:HEAT repeats
VVSFTWFCRFLVGRLTTGLEYTSPRGRAVRPIDRRYGLGVTQPSGDRRQAAALAGHLGDEAGATAALLDPEPKVRIAGLRSLARLGSATTDQLVSALADADSTVRIAALEISALRSSPAIEDLLDDADSMVVETTAWALGERGESAPSTIDRLASIATSHDDPLAREASVAALGAIGDNRGLTAILSATTDKPAVRRRAVIALAAFEGDDVEAAWERARTDRDRQVREAVEELLGPAEGS